MERRTATFYATLGLITGLTAGVFLDRQGFFNEAGKHADSLTYDARRFVSDKFHDAGNFSFPGSNRPK